MAASGKSSCSRLLIALVGTIGSLSIAFLLFGILAQGIQLDPTVYELNDSHFVQPQRLLVRRGRRDGHHGGSRPHTFAETARLHPVDGLRELR